MENGKKPKKELQKKKKTGIKERENAKEEINMKLMEFESNANQIKKPNKKRILIVSAIAFLLVILAVIGCVYIANKPFRNWMDQYVFRKNVEENNLPTIELTEEGNQTIYAYDKYIAVLEKNVLTQYNSSGKKESELKIEINNPIMESNGRFLAIAEKEKQKVYLISGSNIVWEKEVEGTISRVNINRNGYVSVILTGTTYKSIIVLYDQTGKELFKIYLSDTLAVDSDISMDNKYLAFAEINTSGTLIQSTIKIVSVEKAKQSPSESIIYTYQANANSLVLNIKYQEKNKLVCMYDDAIHTIQDKEEEQIINLKEDNLKISFSDIELSGYAIRIVEKASGLFKANHQIEMMNINTKKENIYTIEGIAKTISCYENVIAINLGSEVQFIDTNGWLIKQYSSSQEIKKIILCGNLAGIVYRDKIELISL